MKNLREKYGEWALITGASAGIGEAFVHKLLAKVHRFVPRRWALLLAGGIIDFFRSKDRPGRSIRG